MCTAKHIHNQHNRLMRSKGFTENVFICGHHAFECLVILFSNIINITSLLIYNINIITNIITNIINMTLLVIYFPKITCNISYD